MIKWPKWFPKEVVKFLDKIDFDLPRKDIIPWEKRDDDAMMFFSAPNYYWSHMSKKEVGKILDAILDAGLDGPSIELGGSYASDEYNRKPTTKNIADIYRDQFKKWEVWEEGLRDRGLIAHIAFLNTNQKQANKISDSEWDKLAREFVAKYGTRNKIILPASERDDRTRDSIVNTLNKTFSQIVPNGQLVSYSGSPGAYKEHHSQRGNDIKKGNAKLLNVSDSGPAIAYLYGGSWRSGGTPNLANIHAYVSTIKKSGTSGAVYSFGKKFDYAGCKAAGEAWRK